VDTEVFYLQARWLAAQYFVVMDGGRGEGREGVGRRGRQKTHDLFPFGFIYLQRSCDVKIAKSVFLGYRPISLKDTKAQRYNAIHF